MPFNPGARAGAHAELLADAARPDELLAALAQCSPAMVAIVRRELEVAGLSAAQPPAVRATQQQPISRPSAPILPPMPDFTQAGWRPFAYAARVPGASISPSGFR